MISTRKELDRESIDLHVFRVVARDSSEFQPLTGTATVTVRVTDVNDNRPVFESSGSNDFFIPTGVREGDFILGVSGIAFVELEQLEPKVLLHSSFILVGSSKKQFLRVSRNLALSSSLAAP